MTDRDRMKALFTEFGIGFTEDVGLEANDIICAYDGVKIVGNQNVHVEFRFTEVGQFEQMGVHY